MTVYTQTVVAVLLYYGRITQSLYEDNQIFCHQFLSKSFHLFISFLCCSGGMRLPGQFIDIKSLQKLLLDEVALPAA